MIDVNKLLIVKGLARSFGEVGALNGASFDLEPGEVLGLVGQRGAGKSTLLRLLSGADLPTGGEVIFDGCPVQIKKPAHARRLGIEMIYQDPEMAENQSVVQNMFMGRETTFMSRIGVWPRSKEMEQVARDLFTEFNLPPELVNEPISHLTTEQCQIVALARGLCHPARLLLFDNTLAALSYDRQQILINRIRELAGHGCAVIISSDDLKHIFAVTNRILVLYQGNQAALKRTSETTPREIVELIVGSNRQDIVTPVIWAFESYHAAQQQAEELSRSQVVLRQNLQAKDSLNRQLVDRLRDQVKALDALNLALQDANHRLMTEREAERKALARDLHDQVIQDLLSYGYQLEGLEGECDSADQRDELANIRGGIRQVVSSLRQVCSDLRPPTLDSQGLSAAVRSLAHDWSRQSSVKVDLEIDPGLGRLPEHIELSVFRIIQEGLSNVRKHANARNVRLLLQRMPAAGLAVEIVDDGQGLPTPVDLAALSEEKHYGLVGIGERVSLLGGTMQVTSPVTGGAALRIEIPSPYPSLSTD